MAHEKYHTEALLLGSHSFGENSRIGILFTERFGLLRAVCQGSRKHSSKLNFHLGVPSRCEATLVRGKEYWRLVGANEGELYWKTFESERKKLEALSRLFHFLPRFIHGEGSGDVIYPLLGEFVSSLKNIEESNVLLLEGLALGRILRELGYFPDSEELAFLFVENIFSENLIHEARGKEKLLFTAINTAIAESHL